MKKPKWTAAEDNILKSKYPTSTIKELIAILPGRSWCSIYARSARLELKKEAGFWESEKSGRFNVKNSVSTRFKKGNVPFNKGMKGVYFGGEKSQFKPGNLPHNTKHDGAISERPHKGGTYLYIRVEKAKWVLLHRHVWEQHNPPLQKGEVVAFIDGDYKNCDISNLMLLSRKENMKRNSITRYPEDVRKAIHVVAKLQKRINKIENGTQ